MAAEETPQSIPPPPRNMINHSPTFSSLRDPDFLELVWKNGQVLIQGLPTTSYKVTKRSKTSGFPNSSRHDFPQREGSNTSFTSCKDRGAAAAAAADSTGFGDPLSNLSVLTKSDGQDKKKKKKTVHSSYPNCSNFGSDRTQLLSNLNGFDNHEHDDHFNVVNSQLPRVGKLGYCYLDKQANNAENHVVPVNNFKDLRQSCSYGEQVDKISRQDYDREVPQSPLKELCEAASVPSMRSKQRNSGSRIVDDDGNDHNGKEKRQRVNFSIFVRPIHQALPKSNHPTSCGVTRPTTHSPEAQGNARSIPAPTTSSNPFDMARIEQTSDSEGIGISSGGKEGNGAALAADSEQLPRKDDQTLLPDDQQSEAVVGYKDHSLSNTRFQYKSAEKMVANSSSVCSRGASNSPPYTLKRRYEDTDLISTQVYIREEGEGGKKKAAAMPAARASKGGKTKRKSQVHSQSERKRRDKINKKMRALKELIPNCNKVDKASMLDEAIEYLKTLQLQAQMMMMSMGSGVYMPPPMMLPTAMQHINAQYLATCSMAIGNGMGTRMPPPPLPQMGFGSPAQFPTASSSSVLLSGGAGMAEASRSLSMVGFPDAHQVLMMSMAGSPFASLAAATAAATANARLFSPQLSLLHAQLNYCSQPLPPPPSPPAVVPLSTSTGSTPTSH